MSMLIKAFMIIMDGVVWLSAVVTFALFCSMVYMVCYYIKANRTETDPFDRKSNRESKTISTTLGFACLCVTVILVWVATEIMKMI